MRTSNFGKNNCWPMNRVGVCKATKTDFFVISENFSEKLIQTIEKMAHFKCLFYKNCWSDTSLIGKHICWYISHVPRSNRSWVRPKPIAWVPRTSLKKKTKNPKCTNTLNFIKSFDSNRHRERKTSEKVRREIEFGMTCCLIRWVISYIFDMFNLKAI